MEKQEYIILVAKLKIKKKHTLLIEMPRAAIAS